MASVLRSKTGNPVSGTVTLKKWRLPNKDTKFDDGAYLSGLSDYAKKANVVFRRVIAKLP